MFHTIINVPGQRHMFIFFHRRGFQQFVPKGFSIKNWEGEKPWKRVAESRGDEKRSCAVRLKKNTNGHLALN